MIGGVLVRARSIARSRCSAPACLLWYGGRSRAGETCHAYTDTPWSKWCQCLLQHCKNSQHPTDCCLSLVALAMRPLPRLRGTLCTRSQYPISTKASHPSGRLATWRSDLIRRPGSLAFPRFEVTLHHDRGKVSLLPWRVECLHIRHRHIGRRRI